MQMIKLRMKYINIILRIITILQAIESKLIAIAQEKLNAIDV